MGENKLKKAYRNICLTEWVDKKLQQIELSNKERDEKLSEINNKLDALNKNIEIIKRNSNEILYAEIFHDTSKNSKWLHEELSLSSGAIGYPLAYILYRILDEVKPKSILELGLGQSTKIITSYVKFEKKVIHDVVEHDQNWINFFKMNMELEEVQNIHCLENYKRKYNDCELNAYRNFKKEFKGKSYDLILIDGPIGWGQEYARMDILDIIPECLNKSFIILLDDSERIGEQRMIEMLEEKLRKNKIEFRTGYQYWGVNTVYVCTSEDLEFLCHI